MKAILSVAGQLRQNARSAFKIASVGARGDGQRMRALIAQRRVSVVEGERVLVAVIVRQCRHRQRHRVARAPCNGVKDSVCLVCGADAAVRSDQRRIHKNVAKCDGVDRRFRCARARSARARV